MKRFFLLSSFFFLCFYSELKAQWNTAIYAELLGDGFIVSSINVDQRLSAKNGGLGIRLGLSFTESNLTSAFYNVPMLINYLIGDEKHFLEIGLGSLYTNRRIELAGSQFPQGFHGVGSLMYRFHAVDSILIIRAGLSTFTNRDNFSPIWPGISLGFRFFKN